MLEALSLAPERYTTMIPHGSPAAPISIDVPFPEIERWQRGNAGLPYVWTFESGHPGPHVLVQALTHGNEVCGAIALDWALRQGLRPCRGRLTLCFANPEAYHAFDPAAPFASRCVEEDFNRLWSEDVLAGNRDSSELRRARELRPLYDSVDLLLDLHSMTDPCAPLALAGNHGKGVELARAIGIPAYIVVDAGHAAGKRVRDYAFFDDPDDARTALLMECGQHWERASPRIAKEAMLRLLQHARIVDDGWGLAPVRAQQRVIVVTQVVRIESDRFRFVRDVHSLQVVAQAGTLLAYDGDVPIRTPYDDCVLIMPTRRPNRNETAVRLGRFRA